MIGGMQMPAKYYNWVTYSVSAPYLLRTCSVSTPCWDTFIWSKCGAGSVMVMLVKIESKSNGIIMIEFFLNIYQ